MDSEHRHAGTWDEARSGTHPIPARLAYCEAGDRHLTSGENQQLSGRRATTLTMMTLLVVPFLFLNFVFLFLI